MRTKGRGENSWLLIKHRDKYASETDITEKTKSVVSGKTLEKMKAAPDKIYKQKTQKANTEKKKTNDQIINIGDTPKTPFPKALSPMLATLVDRTPQHGEWLYEIKWDGYRAIAFCNKTKIELSSRNNKSFNEKFYPVFHALKNLNLQAVLDG